MRKGAVTTGIPLDAGGGQRRKHFRQSGGVTDMEWSALVYIGLTVVTVALGFCVDNRGYVPVRVGSNACWERRGSLCERRLARNRIAIFAVYCLLTGVSACRIAVGNDYWVYRFNFNLIAQSRHVSSEFGFNSIVKWIRSHCIF